MRAIAKIAVFVASVICLTTSDAFAQQSDTTRTQVERDAERAVFELNPDDAGQQAEELVEFLQNLAANPVNVNRASVDDLMQIPGMNLRTALAITEYRATSPPFITVDDLLKVNGVGSVMLNRIRPYITAGSGSELRRDLYMNPRYWTTGSHFEMFSRTQSVLQNQEGYLRPPEEGGFLGSPLKYYQRFRYTSRHISANLTQEKDPGEPLRVPEGFDFNSWHIALQDNGRLKRFIIGDYSVGFGQGLILWNGAAFGKGSDVTRSVMKNDRGIRPYTSAQETNFFRGGAVTWGNQIQITAFYSSRRRTSSLATPDSIRFPVSDGLHRTLNERERRFNTHQTTAGGRIRAEIPNGFIGVSGYYNEFDRPVRPGTQSYNLFDFSGRTTSAFSFDYRYLAGSATLFGEGARTQNGGYGILSGAIIDAGSDTELNLTYRNYGRRFQSIFGAGFSEQSGFTRNEEGFYAGIRHRITPELRAGAYFDQFRFSGPRFGTRQPTLGYDWLGIVEYRPIRSLDLFALVRYKVRDEEYASSDDWGREVRLLDQGSRTTARFHVAYQLNPYVRLRSRIEYVRAEGAGDDPSTGYLIYQDIRLTPNPKWTLDARVTLFETDDFSSRVYQFENDLLYVMSNVALFDQGQRMYLLINHKPSRHIDIWLKLSTTLYENRQVISSGNTMIMGNRRSDAGVQVRLRF
jgi:competence ComEA-like helix-hairpin-helix protein